MNPVPTQAIALLTLALLAGCETTLSERRRFELPEGTQRVLIVDRHGLYFGEYASIGGPSNAAMPLFPEPMHPPHARRRMPIWLDEVDREVPILLEQGIAQRGENDWSYELVFPPSPMPAAYDADPFDMSQLWPDPLSPEEVVKLAKEHSCDAVVALEHLTILVTYMTHDSNAQQLVRDGNNIYQIDEPYQIHRFLNIDTKFGFRSYDAKTGKPVDEKVIKQPNLAEWYESRSSPATVGADQTKLDLARDTLVHVARVLDKSLIARDIKIH